jgi:hypothetical protein
MLLNYDTASVGRLVSKLNINISDVALFIMVLSDDTFYSPYQNLDQEGFWLVVSPSHFQLTSPLTLHF